MRRDRAFERPTPGSRRGAMWRAFFALTTSCACILPIGRPLSSPALQSAAASVATRAESSRRVVCNHRSYDYLLSTPNAHDRLPAIMLLHGAGGQGSDMVSLWAPLASREHIVLIAPQLPRELSFEQQAPAVFRCILADAERVASIDAQRVYLFGYSMGGYLAFDGAMFDSDLFAGAGVYAAAINEDYDAIVDSAQRKIPIALYIGDRDRFFSIEQVRRTKALLEAHGFPVRYTELAGQDHSYTPVHDRVNEDAWAYLSASHLPR